MTAPLITIGMTSYNAAQTIERAVKSALAQCWDNKEIVIVDDASTDGTQEILQRYQSDQLKVILVENNAGVAAARNRIIDAAQGEFIAFFDDDDESDLERLKVQYERITAYEKRFSAKWVVCHAARQQHYPDGAVRYEPTMGADEQALAPNGEAVAQRILTGKPCKNVFGSTATCSQMARTALYKEVSGFDTEFRRSEDTDFNVRAALAGAHFAGIAQALVNQTMTASSEKRVQDEQFYALKLLEKHRDSISGSYAFCRGWLEAKYKFLQGHKARFVLEILKLFIRYPFQTLRRFYWALPNVGFNMKSKQFFREMEE